MDKDAYRFRVNALAVSASAGFAGASLFIGVSIGSSRHGLNCLVLMPNSSQTA